MGKRIIARARGKGGPRYRAPSHRYLGKVTYAPVTGISGKVLDIVHDPARSAPVAIIKLEDGKEILHIAPEGLRAGDLIVYDGEPKVGNVLPLEKIPEGTKICCIETFPGSGPKLCRSSGSFSIVLGKTKDKVKVQFPSGKIRELDKDCRAMIGVPAGGGRVEKPFVKAGKKFYAMKARGKLWPRVKGVVMSPVDHPYGGKSHRPRPSKTVSRHAPPGAKVGSIAARRTGRKKGK
ncbi:MAG: 50S ribosomal protein L2 [Candidatus Aenigmarchaeota archaeon]|nr:50S ribosomal protein L2 [Candidatus Aenigmarchaeota archaeon]